MTYESTKLNEAKRDADTFITNLTATYDALKNTPHLKDELLILLQRSDAIRRTLIELVHLN